MNAKEAREKTLIKIRESLYEEINKAIEQNKFYFSCKRIVWEKLWKELLEEELINKGYKITETNDKYSVVISWR